MDKFAPLLLLSPFLSSHNSVNASGVCCRVNDSLTSSIIAPRRRDMNITFVKHLPCHPRRAVCAMRLIRVCLCVHVCFVELDKYRCLSRAILIITISARGRNRHLVRKSTVGALNFRACNFLKYIRYNPVDTRARCACHALITRPDNFLRVKRQETAANNTPLLRGGRRIAIAD